MSNDPSLPVCNLFAPSAAGRGETIQPLIEHPAFTLEHIVSRGEASPEGFWYDQPRAEWVALLRGTAGLVYENGDAVELNSGDVLAIPAGCRHRVTRTSADALWLALHYHRESC